MVLSVIESDRTLSHVRLSENIVVIEGFCSTVSSYDGDKIEIVIEIMSVKLLVIVIIVFKRYPSTYCLMQGRCFIL